MKKADAYKALDDAMRDGIIKDFSALVLGLVSGRDAVARFERGIRLHVEAYVSASSVIEAQFKD